MDWAGELEAGEETLDLAPLVVPNQVSPWPPKMTFDLALGDSPETVCERYQITPEQYDRYIYHPAFRREVSEHQREIRENGVTFKEKAKVQAEMYLQDLDDLVTDTRVSPAVRLDAIKSVVKWAGFEPTKDANQTTNVPQFNIQINL